LVAGLVADELEKEFETTAACLKLLDMLDVLVVAIGLAGGLAEFRKVLLTLLIYSIF